MKIHDWRARLIFVLIATSLIVYPLAGIAVHFGVIERDNAIAGIALGLAALVIDVGWRHRR